VVFCSDFGKETFMQAIVRRAVLPALLLIGGLASLIYGAKFHFASVVEERERETTIEVPPPFLPPFGEASPFGGPPFRKEVVKEKLLVTTAESEPALVREVTIGGVALTPAGALKRTYSGKAPSLCPT